MATASSSIDRNSSVKCSSIDPETSSSGCCGTKGVVGAAAPSAPSSIMTGATLTLSVPSRLAKIPRPVPSVTPALSP
eukprot:1377691-Heterocapsa_arctica.AAC.1